MFRSLNVLRAIRTMNSLTITKIKFLYYRVILHNKCYYKRLSIYINEDKEVDMYKLRRKYMHKSTKYLRSINRKGIFLNVENLHWLIHAVQVSTNAWIIICLITLQTYPFVWHHMFTKYTEFCTELLTLTAHRSDRSKISLVTMRWQRIVWARS